MAFLDTTRIEQHPAPGIAWEGVMAQLDRSRVELARRPAPTAQSARHKRFVQQMMLAASMTAGAILAVCAVMLVMLL